MTLDRDKIRELEDDAVRTDTLILLGAGVKSVQDAREHMDDGLVSLIVKVATDQMGELRDRVRARMTPEQRETYADDEGLDGHALRTWDDYCALMDAFKAVRAVAREHTGEDHHHCALCVDCSDKVSRVLVAGGMANTPW